MINSGNANAETGEKGFADALAMSERAADALGLETEQVAVAETGVIGVPMPMSAVLPGIERGRQAPLRRRRRRLRRGDHDHRPLAEALSR